MSLKIPKIIHMIWIGPDECPYKESIESYKRNNPGWEVKVWDNEAVSKFDIHNKWVYEKMTSWAGKADVLRLEILYNYGGLYVDVDSRCLKPLDNLVDGLVCFGMRADRGGVCNAVLGCTPKHPAFEKIVYSLEEHVKRLSETKKNIKKGISLHSIAGGRYITPILREDPTFIQFDEGCTPGERKLVGPVKDIEVLRSGYIVQFHDGSWKKTGKRRIKL